MASLTLPKHSIPSLLPNQTLSPRHSLFSHNLPIISNSSQSQFYGLKVSYSSSFSISSSSSSSSSVKGSIFAKVNKGTAPPSFTLKDQDRKKCEPLQL
ncbi:peroxiredoxin q [Quercus suber]|uniref:Peroxiredoxin q n=1 Tax=Quercus suber TaxID=58331 RepID=A0AAW0LBX5_QUESU